MPYSQTHDAKQRSVQRCNGTTTRFSSNKFVSCAVQLASQPPGRVFPSSVAHDATHEVPIKPASHFLTTEFNGSIQRLHAIRILTPLRTSSTRVKRVLHTFCVLLNARLRRVLGTIPLHAMRGLQRSPNTMTRQLPAPSSSAHSTSSRMFEKQQIKRQRIKKTGLATNSFPHPRKDLQAGCFKTLSSKRTDTIIHRTRWMLEHSTSLHRRTLLDMQVH